MEKRTVKTEMKKMSQVKAVSFMLVNKHNKTCNVRKT
jgi:hypothetical protein